MEDGQVIGGFAQGSNSWDAVNGLFDGENLQVTFVNDQSGCGQWLTHYYEVNSTTVILRTTVNRCGEAMTNRNVSYAKR